MNQSEQEAVADSRQPALSAGKRATGAKFGNLYSRLQLLFFKHAALSLPTCCVITTVSSILINSGAHA